jgi:hypothetical protein
MYFICCTGQQQREDRNIPTKSGETYNFQIPAWTIINSRPFSEGAERILEDIEVSFVVTKRVGA